jgi:hypothetical protein
VTTIPLTTPAQTIANLAFPRWIFWRDDWRTKRALLASIISRKPATVTWGWVAPYQLRGCVEVSNSDYPELGSLRISHFSARRLERLRRVAVPTRDGHLSSVCLKALSGLGRLLANLPPLGISHSAVYQGTAADERLPPLSDELKIALNSFPPRDTGLAASPNPIDKNILVSRGVDVCEVRLARLLTDRGHLLSLPDGSYRLAD